MIKEIIQKRIEERRSYDTSELFISRIGVYNSESEKIEYTKRYVFKGPFNDGEKDYYEIFPTMDPVYVYGENAAIFFAELTKFNSLFPDLKRVTKKQINNIVTELYEKDLISGQYIPDDEDPNNKETARLTLGETHDLH